MSIAYHLVFIHSFQYYVLKNLYCEDFLCLSGAKYALEHLYNGTPFRVKEQQILHKSKTVAENMIIVLSYQIDIFQETV